MWNDPIVEETRAIRDQIASRFDYDVRALGEYFKSKRSSDSKLLISRAKMTGIASTQSQQKQDSRKAKTKRVTPP